MAATSNMLPLGTTCPEFSLVNAVDGKTVDSRSATGKAGLLVMFICNHCPYVVHVQDQFAKLEKDYVPRGVAIVAINSNSERTYPQDGPVHMAALAKGEGWGFPFVFDRTQEVARAFGAACTPEFYLFDSQRSLVYRGRLDESSPKNGLPLTGKDLRAAIESMLTGAPVSSDQKPSVGCAIKWE